MEVLLAGVFHEIYLQEQQKIKVDGVVKSPIYCVVAIFQAFGIPYVLPRT